MHLRAGWPRFTAPLEATLSGLAVSHPLKSDGRHIRLSSDSENHRTHPHFCRYTTGSDEMPGREAQCDSLMAGQET